MIDPSNPSNHALFLCCQVGDWTQELFRLSLGDLCMPIWITAAQPSVLEKSIFFDNGESTPARPARRRLVGEAKPLQAGQTRSTIF